jgi:hypothetical protein
VCVCCGARDSWVTVPAHSREKSPAFALRILRRCVVSRRPSLSIGPTKQRQCMTTSIQNLTTYGIRSNSRRQDCFISSTLQIPSLKPKAQNLVVSKATTFVSWKLRACVCVCVTSCSRYSPITKSCFCLISRDIRIQQRNGRKTLTTVQGLPNDLDLPKILKAFKKVRLFCTQ